VARGFQLTPVTPELFGEDRRAQAVGAGQVEDLVKARWTSAEAV
jgi:hypothetical protein